MLAGMSTGPLLIVWHSRTGASEQLAAAAAEGAGERARLLRAGETVPDDLLGAGGYLFCCPENLASMSGEMKEMFDRCYYPVLGRIEGRPYATMIAAGSDGEGAQRQIDRIATGWRLKRVTDPWIVMMHAQEPAEILAPKTVEREVREQARELGAALAEGICQGIF
jgi:NAD(P)H-dependent FMN reductase